ncbi:unnamed protein product [Adineta steineri]|uniref:Uncharacterized protein n=1 Tax=Adineta steineri TaxID=433720 RepID=A0A818KZH0_9BILA|nr:unnamed protein product [Adineta steineri]CAF3558598.1 unnamed protein product [Adineta steineri]
MEISNTEIVENSKTNDNNESNQDQHSSQDINQLVCCLKNAIFSKYISDYLIDKTEEMWVLYEKRIDKFLKEKHFNINCKDTHPQTSTQLKEVVKYQQKNILECKRDLEILCSSSKRLRTDKKYLLLMPSNQRVATSSNSISIPKTPRCINRYKITNDIYNINIDN